jgi:hypothetical protein
MSYRFTNCLNTRGLRKFPVDRSIIEKELQESRKDLESARKSLQEQDYKWTIIKRVLFHVSRWQITHPECGVY